MMTLSGEASPDFRGHEWLPDQHVPKIFPTDVRWKNIPSSDSQWQEHEQLQLPWKVIASNIESKNMLQPGIPCLQEHSHLCTRRLQRCEFWAGHGWLTLVILATQEAKIRRITVQSQPWQIVRDTLFQKHPTWKRAGKVASVVECLPSKCEALSLIPNTTKKKKKH
jgi:hypothetical protein